MEDHTRRKRLIFRSTHRGNKEMDLVFSQFIEAHLPALSAAELDIYEALLEENDVDIWDWVTGKPCPEQYLPFIERMRA
ncbi:MAG: succinate dehydrogenase assembly factor 2 [Alphaproteobacteria bacterium]|nr:succinate dehydrogenase assembly factor 2 [Alphaproteobacteria bacterium]